MKALLVAALLAARCSTPAPAPVPSGPTCADACAALARHGCEEAQPTDAGASCVDVCENAGDLPVSCIINAESCDAAEACE